MDIDIELRLADLKRQVAEHAAEIANLRTLIAQHEERHVEESGKKA